MMTAQVSPGSDPLLGVAHDLRSPLSAIMALTESLQEGVGGPLTPTQRRQLGMIYTTALCLCETTNDVLDLMRKPDERRHVSRVGFEVPETLEKVRATVLPMAEEGGTALEVGCNVRGRRVGDELGLRRTLLNLVTNALKVSTGGRVRLLVREAPLDHVEFTVTDTGPGLDLGGLRDLSRPHPADATTRTMLSSAGLGLLICRDLVEQMGGELLVETQRGAGSSFFFVIPLRPVIESERISAPVPAESSGLPRTPALSPA